MSTLELDLVPGHARRLFRHTSVSVARQGRMRTTQLAVTWHEFGGPAGLSLSVRDSVWRLERPLRRFGAPAGCETVAEAASPDLLPQLVEHVVPRAALSGRCRSVDLAGEAGPLVLSLVEGTLRDVSREWPCCRVLIDGDERQAAQLAFELGETLGLSMPMRSLGEETIAVSRGAAPPPPMPMIDATVTVDDAIRTILGELACTVRYWTPAAARGEGSVAVHQMRVAVRRLRSALLVFKEPLGGSLDGLRPALVELAASLGDARDWDVFLEGTGAELSQAMEGEKRIASLLAEAARSREAVYAALRRTLAAPATRRLLLHLSLLPMLAPWRTSPAAEDVDPLLARPVREFAPRVLDRRYKRLIGAQDDLAGLPASALHDTRKSGKKLRYALEFFAPLLPRRDVRRLARRLARAQDELGAINDTATGAALLARLTRGGQHEFASGAVLGWLSAKADAARAPLEDTWGVLRRQNRFWRQQRAAQS